MKKYLLLLSLVISSSTTFAFDGNIKGFFAFDLFGLQKKESRDQEADTGLGTIDLKFYFNHEDFNAKIKLDLDGDLSDSNNLYEEATVTWKLLPSLKLQAGKGKVRFHQMHYGIVQSSYVDGGSVLGTRHGLRDQDRKLIVAAIYGGWKQGFRNTLTFFGDASQRTGRSSGRDYARENDYESQKDFNSKDERGVANRIEFYPIKHLTVATAGYYHKKDFWLKERYAFDLSAQYRTWDLDIWFEYVYAFVPTHPNDKYATAAQYEQIIQAGIEKKINDKISVVFNAEAAFVNSQEFNYTRDDTSVPTEFTDKYSNADNNNGEKNTTDTWKVETGINYRAAKRVSLKLGFMYEQQKLGYGSVQNDWTGAYRIGSGISYWF